MGGRPQHQVWLKPESISDLSMLDSIIRAFSMKNLLKYTLASAIGTLVGMGLLFGLGIGGLILLIAVAASSGESGPKVEDKSILVLDLSATITDVKPSSTTAEALSEALSNDDRSTTIALRAAIDSLEAAAEDDRIVGLYIHGSTNGTGTGLANLKEVRAALEKFRASGKEIVAYDMSWSEREYYLGSVANKIVVNPLGIVEINGLASESMFFAGALEKFGIGVQVTRVGKYKSAVEPFLLTKRSPESRQQAQKLLDDIWSDFLVVASKHREFSAEQLQGLVNGQGIVMAEEARNEGLVDKLAYFDEVVTDLKELTESDPDDRTFRQISLPSYAGVVENKNAKANSDSENIIGIVYAEGEIVSGQGTPSQIGGDRLAKELRDLRLDEDIKAVVLRVNSPGGSATASETIQREVELIREVKPIVVSMGNMAASGGYWISSYGTKIFAEPNTITGSIGVFGLLFNVQEIANQNGITWDMVKTGRYADFETITRPKTKQELAINQRFVDLIYERFLTIVADSRQIPKTKLAEIAQGRIWSGQEAKNLNLIDEIGGIEEALYAAAELAELEDDWKVEEYPRYPSLEEQILEKIGGIRAEAPGNKPDPLTAQFQKLREELAILGSLNDPVGAYTRLPYNFRID